MSGTHEQITGHCLCGAVTVTATPAKPHLEACCRRWCGSAYLAVQSDTAPRFSGEEHITRFKSSNWAERGFCSKCGSNLFYCYPNGQLFLPGRFV